MKILHTAKDGAAAESKSPAEVVPLLLLVPLLCTMYYEELCNWYADARGAAGPYSKAKLHDRDRLELQVGLDLCCTRMKWKCRARTYIPEGDTIGMHPALLWSSCIRSAEAITQEG